MKVIDWSFNIPFGMGAFWALFCAAEFSLDEAFLWGAFAIAMMVALDVLFKGILFRRKPE